MINMAALSSFNVPKVKSSFVGEMAARKDPICFDVGVGLILNILSVQKFR